MSIVLATARPEPLSEFTAGLTRESGLEVELAPTGAMALELIKTEKPKLVVVDEGLPDIKPLELVREIVMASAMTLTAVVTSMTEDDFHEASEGYGVLMALPALPAREHGKELAELLAQV